MPSPVPLTTKRATFPDAVDISSVTKPVVRAEAEEKTVSALSVFFPSNEVFVFYELREPLGNESLTGWSTI